MSQRYQRSKDWAYRSVFGGREGLLVPLIASEADLSAVLVLNEVGAFIWEQLAEPISRDELAARVATEFEATPAALAEDVADYLEDLAAIKAVALSAAVAG